jgi:transcriptional regulator
MRDNPLHESTDVNVVRRLIKDNPWATLVSSHHDALVASHYPILLDEDSEELAIFTHVGRPDEKIHGLGESEMMVIVEGPNGYISPSWYSPGDVRAPTWNFSVAHCYGVPQILSEDETLNVLGKIVARFEQYVDEPMMLDPEWGRPIARGTVGIRLPVSRFICKVKMSQDKSVATQERILSALRAPGQFHNEILADDMARVLGNE